MLCFWVNAVPQLTNVLFLATPLSYINVYLQLFILKKSHIKVLDINFARSPIHTLYILICNIYSPARLECLRFRETNCQTKLEPECIWYSEMHISQAVYSPRFQSFFKTLHLRWYRWILSFKKHDGTFNNKESINMIWCFKVLGVSSCCLRSW